MKALISGINGFVGHYLTRELLAHGRTVFGFDRAPQTALAGVTYQSIDMQDYETLFGFVAKVKPDEIYHLAGISSPPQADASPRQALSINIMGSICLLDAMLLSVPSSKILLIGSSKEYGEPATGQIDEKQPLDPYGFYAASKSAVEFIGKQYVNQYSLDIRFTRSFNHTGPGQSPQFVCSDWARQVALITRKKQPPKILIGAINSMIDFTDVRDVARAYCSILERGQKGEVYNVCSGKAVALQDILNHLIQKSPCSIQIVSDPDKTRKNKPSTSADGSGSFQKLQRQTGWAPAIDIFTSLDELYEYWLSQDNLV